jgi:hypothetical protein
MSRAAADRRTGAEPRERAVHRVLVDGRTAVNYEIVAPVVRLMAQDPRIEFAFTASEEPSRVAEIHANAPGAYPRLAPWRAALAKWDVYLTSDFMWATLPRGAARVQMYHGVAGKYGFDAPTASLRDWHRLFFINERRLRNVIAAGALDADSPAPRLIGMPKVDCLVDGSLHRDDAIRRCPFDSDRPTVVYAPTWSPESSLNRHGVPLLERLVEMPINLIVKLHDRSLDRGYRYSGGVDWRATLQPLLSRPNAMLASGSNITPWLVAADVLITDHSSAAYEYLLLDRPVVRIEMPALLATANVHPQYVQLLADVSENVTTAVGAAEAVTRGLADPGARSAARRAVAADLFYRPGTAAARAAAALYELMGIPPHPASVAASVRVDSGQTA